MSKKAEYNPYIMDFSLKTTIEALNYSYDHYTHFDASEMLCTHTRMLELFHYHYEGSYNPNTNVPKAPQS
jgi:hypothetical protein